MKRWEAWFIRAGFALVSASGVLLAVLKYFLAGSDPDSRVGHPWQPAVTAAHVLAAPVAVFVLGLLWRSHALSRLKNGEPEGRSSGTTLTMIGLPLVLSGYVVQVLTAATARKWTGWFHAALGLIFALAFALHLPGSRPPDEAPETPPETQRRLP